MAVEAIATAVGQGFGMAGKFAEARNTKMQGILADKQGFQDTQSRLLQLRQQRESQKQQALQERAKTQRTAIVVVLVFLGVLILAGIGFYIFKNK